MKKLVSISLIMLLLLCASINIGTLCLASGEGFGLHGDLMTRVTFSSESSYDKFFSELSNMTRDYVIEHKLVLQIAGFKSPESTGLSLDIVGDNIEQFADEYGAHEYARKSAPNVVCLIYVDSTNEFTYRTYLKDDSGVDIDWAKVEKAFCNDDDLETKYRNVCSIITTGEEINKNDQGGLYVSLIVIGVVVLAGLVTVFIIRHKKKAL